MLEEVQGATFVEKQYNDSCDLGASEILSWAMRLL